MFKKNSLKKNKKNNLKNKKNSLKKNNLKNKKNYYKFKGGAAESTDEISIKLNLIKLVLALEKLIPNENIQPQDRSEQRVVAQEQLSTFRELISNIELCIHNIITNYILTAEDIIEFIHKISESIHYNYTHINSSYTDGNFFEDYKAKIESLINNINTNVEDILLRERLRQIQEMSRPVLQASSTPALQASSSPALQQPVRATNSMEYYRRDPNTYRS